VGGGRSREVASEHDVNASGEVIAEELCKVQGKKSQFAQMITVTLSLLIAACFTLVSPQLALVQHTALMALYDALGLGTVTEKRKKQRAKNIFLEAKTIIFFFF
jgi:hypothetical protein